MSSSGRVVTISNIGTASRFEWIVQVDKRTFIESPNFSMNGSKWCLGIKRQSPMKLKRNIAVEVRLRRVQDSQPARITDFILGVKTVEGAIQELPKQTFVFDDDHEFSDHYKIYYPDKLVAVTCTLILMDLPDDVAPGDLPSVSIGNTTPLPDLAQLSEDFREMFISGKACDATVKVRETAYSVHKGVLEIRSPVFAAMFEADMKEKDTNTVEIVDCDPEAFRDFLLYLYSGTTEKMSQNVVELFKISDKYNVQELKSKCLAFLMGNLNSKNVLDAFVLAHQFVEVELKRKAQAAFAKNFKSIVSSDKWKSFLNANSSLANDLLISMSEKIEYKD